MSDRLYNCDFSGSKIYELDTSTRVDISSGGVSVTSGPSGIGGIAARLYYTNLITDKNYEIDPDTLSAINTVNSMGNNPRGIGGTEDRLYHCDDQTNKLYELDIDTLADLSSGGVTGPLTGPFNDTVNANGIGGTIDRVYYIDPSSNGGVYEMDPDTLAVINGEVSVTDSQGTGIGGITDDLFYCGRSGDVTYELDLDTLAEIGSSVSTPGSDPYGIGGIFPEPYTINDISVSVNVDELDLTQRVIPDNINISVYFDDTFVTPFIIEEISISTTIDNVILDYPFVDGEEVLVSTTIENVVLDTILPFEELLISSSIEQVLLKVENLIVDDIWIKTLLDTSKMGITLEINDMLSNINTDNVDISFYEFFEGNVSFAVRKPKIKVIN